MITNQQIRIADYKPHRRNYNRHPARQVERIAKSLQKFGQVRSVVVWRKFFLAGHGVVQAAQSLGWETLKADMLPDDYPEELATAYIAADNELGKLSDPDEAALAAILDEAATFDPELLAAIGYDNAEFDRLLDSIGGLSAPPPPPPASLSPAIEPAEFGDANELPPLPHRERVPDAIWPSDNDWGIPLLDINRQAKAIDQPWAIWGTVSRKTRMNGTWLFYTEDYRYEALWADPSPLLNSNCVNAVEPNFSCYENMPPAVAIWQIYRKRWIARWWQSYGVRILVDLNVAVNHAELNRLGIPAGWNAFATRGYTERIEATHQEYEIARQIAGEGATPLFVVYGGGKTVKAECQRMGWLWLQEDMDTAKGREV